jgi:hypothetical protein
VKYDDAAWHYEGNFPAGVAPENGATHIGMFFGWAIQRDLVSDRHHADEDVAFDLERIRNRQLRPRDFVLNWTDGQLTDDDLNDEGNAFAAAYYQERYLADWAELFPDNYRVDDSWENFDRVLAILDWRFDSWREGGDRREVQERQEEQGSLER